MAEMVAELLREQAKWCGVLGSPLYEHLLYAAADNVAAGGPCADVLRGHGSDPEGSALALRFMGAVHRLVLEGRAPDLAAHYASAGGTLGIEGAWEAFSAAVANHRDLLRGSVDRPVQTNEVGRCASLLGGWLTVASVWRLPLRLLELGAAAGLNLRWDRFRYEHESLGWGDPESPVLLSGRFAGPHPNFDIDVEVAERSGCDRNPLDPATEDGRTTLMAYVWPDQVARHQRLAGAIDVARRVPADVERAHAPDWVAGRLALKAGGTATVVYHSIVTQYIDPPGRERLEETIAQAGAAASDDAPLGWLRMEPAGAAAEVRLTMWPGGDEQVIATSGYHGDDVTWLGWT